MLPMADVKPKKKPSAHLLILNLTHLNECFTNPLDLIHIHLGESPENIW